MLLYSPFTIKGTPSNYYFCHFSIHFYVNPFTNHFDVFPFIYVPFLWFLYQVITVSFSHNTFWYFSIIHLAALVISNCCYFFIHLDFVGLQMFQCDIISSCAASVWLILLLHLSSPVQWSCGSCFNSFYP